MRKVILFPIVLLLCFTITELIGCGGDEEEEEAAGGSWVFNAIPKNGATDVPTTVAILVIFKKDIVTPSVSNLAFVPAVSGDVSYDPDTRTLVLKPSAPLRNNTDSSKPIDGIGDMEGGSMSPVTIKFTTSVPDTEGPIVTLTYPEDGQKDLGHDTEISITFSEPMDRAKFPSSISFDPSAGISDEWLFEWATVGDEQVTVSPPRGIEPFEVNKEYTMKFSRSSVMDLSGNTMPADYELTFRTLKYPVERIGNLNFPNGLIEPVWMYAVGRSGKKWVVSWGGEQPKGAPSQNTPSGTITASADGQIQDSVEAIPSNASNVFTPTVTKGNGNRMTFETVNLNNNRRFRMVFSSTSLYVTFDLRSSAGTIPKQYVHIGNDLINPSGTPFTMEN